MKKILTIFILCFIVCGVAYAQDLSDLKAQARAEVRREMGLDRLPPSPAARPQQDTRTTRDMPSRSIEDIAMQMLLIVMGIALLPAIIAKAKGRSFIAWWVLGVLCFPVVFIISVFMRKVGSGAAAKAVPVPAKKGDNAGTDIANRTFIRGFYDEVFGAWNLDAADQLVADSFVGHDMPDGTTSGPEGFKQFYKGFLASFPDFKYSVEDVVADGDKAVVRWTGKGTHGGVFRGIEPTGKPITIKGVSIYKVQQGKVSESWGDVNIAGLMEQIKA